MGHDADDSDVVQPKSRCRNLCDFLYNSDKGEVLGRTGSSWAKILLFYCVYYGALALFFAICMFGFFSTLDNRAPTQQRLQSLLKFNPGMGYRPRPVVESTLISFNSQNPASYKHLINDMEDFLKDYRTNEVTDAINCLENPGRPLGRDEVCAFDLSVLGPNCTKEQDYGYSSGRPCILLKINRIYDWVPIHVDVGNDSVKAAADSHAARGQSGVPLLTDHYITVTCDGQYEQDIDNIRNVTFYPSTGFPFSFYPYTRQPGYLSPIVMAQFNVVPGRLIIVECKIWQSNIKHHRVDRQGSVVFELMIDHKNSN